MSSAPVPHVLPALVIRNELFWVLEFILIIFKVGIIIITGLYKSLGLQAVKASKAVQWWDSGSVS